MRGAKFLPKTFPAPSGALQVLSWTADHRAEGSEEPVVKPLACESDRDPNGPRRKVICDHAARGLLAL